MIIVTGGAGFIGSAFVWKLNSEGIDDIIIVDKLGASEKWRNLVNRHFLDYIHKDKFLKILCENRLSNISAIIHMGACSSTTERDADYLMENNYGYSKALAEWACKNNVRFIYASSAATYGDGSRTFSDDDATTATLQPLNMYGYSKHLFDLWALRNRLLGKITGIKFFNVFGPNEYHKGDMVSVVFKAFRQIVETGRVKLFRSYRNEYRDGEQMRDFVYVLDCVNIMWWFLQHPEATGIFNLGSGTARTWNDLVKAVFSALGRKTLIEYIEMPESIRDRYQYFSEARMEKLASAGCSLKFRSLEDAVHDYVVNYLAKGNLCL
ncbi:MAG: ADP-glyceromanno-heptose 6-epimerase [Deltaproteobacteria bacterium]|nr:ADP-glyceromanno-heptose 6-epimerase [Deltaproteobacteria bacterium]